jgi:Zn-dependent protease/CBS domain-containing protein
VVGYSVSVKVGSVIGIPVYLHYTLVIAFGLVTWTLASGYMPNEYPGYGPQVYWVIGLASAAILFLSVFVHELAHSYVAKRNGLSIDRIILFIFGGVAQMGEESPSANVEFKVSLVGPATSFAIAGLLGLAYWVAKGTGVEAAYYASLEYGGLVNLLLGGFNLIPAFPLDGGRVFRAILWGRWKNLLTATKTASKLGVAFAYLFIFGGLAFLFTGLFVNGIWFVFIGLFLKNGAEASLRQTILTDALSGVIVEDIMTRNVDTIEADTSLIDVVQNYFSRFKHGGYPILDRGTLVGILTLQDVRRVQREDWGRVRARDVMTPIAKVETANPEDTATDALMRLSKKDVGRLPVVRNGKLVGIITRSDLTHLIKVRSELGG